MERGLSSGNCVTLNGVPGTFAEGLTMGYSSAGPDMYVNSISPRGGTVYLQDQGGTSRAIHNTPDVGRTVMSTVIFSALTSSVERGNLMSAYMDYLVEGLGARESSPAGRARITASPNPVGPGRSVRFTVPAGTRRIAVYDATGRAVAGLAPGGGGATWDLAGPDGDPVVPGTYFVVDVARPSRALPLVVAR